MKERLVVWHKLYPHYEERMEVIHVMFTRWMRMDDMGLELAPVTLS